MAEELEDDGTADRAAEIAVGWIARAYYRRTVYEQGDGANLMLRIADAARSNITPEQWAKLAEADMTDRSIDAIARLEAVAAKHPGDLAVLANLNSVRAFESARKQTEPPAHVQTERGE